jgi:hypothetical protein
MKPWTAVKPRYSDHNITATFSYVTERGEGKMERARGEQDGRESKHVKYN